MGTSKNRGNYNDGLTPPRVFGRVRLWLECEINRMVGKMLGRYAPCWIYLIQLHSDIFTVGYTADADKRLDQYRRMGAPKARLIKKWPAFQAWEEVAIAWVLHGKVPHVRRVMKRPWNVGPGRETFESCWDIQAVRRHLDKLFARLPQRQYIDKVLAAEAEREEEARRLEAELGGNAY